MELSMNNILDFENMAKNHRLPDWEELPEINLYMDQVIILMNKYLKIYQNPYITEKLITPSIINNYVKLKVIPSPIKKKYSKIHIVYLIMVCILKKTLSISTIKEIIPITDEEEIKTLYSAFKEKENAILQKTILKFKEEVSQDNLRDIAITSALNSNAYRLYSDVLTFEEEKKE